jgi:hypothetical protein
MRAIAEERLIGWPGAPVYSRTGGPTPHRRRNRYFLALALIVLVGAVLRFSTLSRPILWGDESATLSRVTGSFADLCGVLQADGFAPLHYELYWWLRSHFIMTPFMMRLVPAIAGTLTVPAMYFLARQLAGRRVAILAALFTACSAWMLNYSRDAKMYAELWLFATLSYGCFLWWCRTGGRIAWWAWVASSVAMVGFQSLGFVVLGVEAIWYLTQHRVHWRASLAYLLGLCVISAGPLGYYHYFNQWHSGDGIGWIDNYNAGRDGIDLTVNLASSFLLKYEFPGAAHRGTPSPTAMRLAAAGLTLATAVVLVGALPWRARRPEQSPITLLPTELPPQPWSRVLLWLGVGIVLPVYGFYCASMPEFMTPAGWATGLSTLVGHQWATVLLVAVAVAAFSMPGREFPATLAVFALVLLGLSAGAALERGGWAEPSAAVRAWGTLLQGPYAIHYGERPNDAVNVYPLAILLGIALGLLWYYCGPAGFVRPRSVAVSLAAAAVVTVLLAFAAALLALTVWAVRNGAGFGPADLWSHARNLFLNPLVLLAAVLIPVVFAAVRGSVDLRLRTLRWARFLAVAAVVLLVCQGVALAMNHARLHVWMPRYLGTVWPLFCVALVILLDRLPTRGLRRTAIALLIGLNLFAHAGRVFADTEPRLDLVARDAVASESHPEHVLTYLRLEQGWYDPGRGSIFNYVGRYYLVLERWQRDGRLDISPWEYRTGGGWNDHFRLDVARAAIAADLEKNPTAHRIVVWDQEEPTAPIPAPDAPDADDVAPLLGPGWKLLHDDRWQVRNHWSWEDLTRYRRREYTRPTPAAPASQPTAQTATAH